MTKLNIAEPQAEDTHKLLHRHRTADGIRN